MSAPAPFLSFLITLYTMFLKIHQSPGAGDVVAVCDRELLNATLRQGDLEINVSEKFYGSDPVTDDDVKKAIKDAPNVNLMGRRAVSIALDLGLIDSGSCIMFGDVPHAQIYRI